MNDMWAKEDLDGLFAAGAAFRDIAVQEALGNFGDCHELFFNWLMTEEQELQAGMLKGSRMELQACSRFPFLAQGMERPRTQPEVFGTFAGMAREQKMFLDSLRRFASAPGGDRILPVAYARFPGIRPELEREYPSIALPVLKNTEGRQLMVFVCGQCNLHCPYCFSHDLVRREIPADDLRRVFRWAVDQGCDAVTPCGGEPLLYSEFQLFLDLVRKNGLTTYLASNFTVPMAGLRNFDGETVKRMYVHFTAESLANPELERIILDNISLCRERGIELLSRVNLLSPDVDTALKWVDFSADHGFSRMNMALTIPSRFGANTYITPERFAEYIPTICRMVDHARNRGISLCVVKPLPLCMFPTETVSQLLATSPSMSLCGIHEDGYMKNLSLSTDMAFSPCLGLTEERVPFSPEVTWDSLAERFAPMVERMLYQPVTDRCGDCFLYAKGLCQGTCLSYKYRG